MNHQPTPEQLDEATQRRLARLSALPVDTSNLERRMQRILTPAVSAHPRWQLLKFRHPVASAVAALLFIVITTAIMIVSLNTQPTLASPTEFAQLHEEVTAENAQVTTVTTLEQANQHLAQQWKEMPTLPTSAPEQLHGCCVRRLMNHNVSCLVLRDGNIPLTLVVGHARDFQCCTGKVVQINGHTYTLHEVNGLQMVMTNHDTRYLCLMGKVPEARLLEIAQKLTF